MDMVLKQDKTDIKILSALNAIKFSNIEKRLSDMFENINENKNLDYIGELNKSDVFY